MKDKIIDIEIVVFGVSSVNASEEDEKMIKEIQRIAEAKNPKVLLYISAINADGFPKILITHRNSALNAAMFLMKMMQNKEPEL